jgi:hypothetical protein
MEEYRSEFEAPDYNIPQRRFEDGEVITTVIMDGELMEFRVPVGTYMAGKALELKAFDALE